MRRCTVLLVVGVMALGAQCSSSRSASDATDPVSTTTTPAVASTIGGAGTDVPTARLPVPADMLNPAVTQATVKATICVDGWDLRARPALYITEFIKAGQAGAYKYADANLANFTEDHVIPVGLGGAILAPVNLYPEPNATYGADDRVEAALRDQVCGGTIQLDDARQRILALKTSHGYRRDVSASTGVTTTTTPSTKRPTTTRTTLKTTASTARRPKG